MNSLKRRQNIQQLTAVSRLLHIRNRTPTAVRNTQFGNFARFDGIVGFDIRPADYNLPTSSLSGGNAQKVVVAREVSLGNKLLVASQPTRGVDIGAIELIRNTLEKAKKAGAGVLLVSAELEEIISLSDRIVVIHEGKITGEMRADEANENNLGLLMMGGTDTGKDGEAAV